jgi:hypothetical protein
MGAMGQQRIQASTRWRLGALGRAGCGEVSCRSSSADLAVLLDAAAVISHELIDDAETKPGATPPLLRREERIEDPVPVLLRDAAPVVDHFEVEAVRRRTRSSAHDHVTASLA